MFSTLIRNSLMLHHVSCDCLLQETHLILKVFLMLTIVSPNYTITRPYTAIQWSGGERKQFSVYQQFLFWGNISSFPQLLSIQAWYRIISLPCYQCSPVLGRCKEGQGSCRVCQVWRRDISTSHQYSIQPHDVLHSTAKAKSTTFFLT